MTRKVVSPLSRSQRGGKIAGVRPMDSEAGSTIMNGSRSVIQTFGGVTRTGPSYWRENRTVEGDGVTGEVRR